MDIGDRGQLAEAAFRRDALDMVKGRQPVGESFVNCVDCGDKIPDGRRLGVRGCTRCVGCQEVHEALEESRR